MLPSDDVTRVGSFWLHNNIDLILSSHILIVVSNPLNISPNLRQFELLISSLISEFNDGESQFQWRGPSNI